MDRFYQIKIAFLCIFCFACVSFLLPYGYAQGNSAIRLSISSERETYTIEEDIVITVIIRNTSGKNIRLKTLPYFAMQSKDESIWGPVRLDTQDINLEANEQPVLVLEPLEEKFLEYNLTKLKWEPLNIPIWPTRPWTSIVRAEKYKVTFELITQTKQPEKIVSNPLKIGIIRD